MTSTVIVRADGGKAVEVSTYNGDSEEPTTTVIVAAGDSTTISIYGEQGVWVEEYTEDKSDEAVDPYAA